MAVTAGAMVNKLCNIVDEVWLYFSWGQNIPKEKSQYHGRWRSGSLCRQITSGHGINYIKITDLCLPRIKISTTCVALRSGNGRKVNVFHVSSKK